MTEAEWRACTDPRRMLEALRDRASDRKLRLFAVACCRGMGRLLPDRSRHAVDAAERFADGQADEAELHPARLGIEFSSKTPESAAFLTACRRFDRPSILFRYGIVDLDGFDDEAQRRVEHIC